MYNHVLGGGIVEEGSRLDGAQVWRDRGDALIHAINVANINHSDGGDAPTAALQFGQHDVEPGGMQGGIVVRASEAKATRGRERCHPALYGGDLVGNRASLRGREALVFVAEVAAGKTLKDHDGNRAIVAETCIQERRLGDADGA